jgi:hypothetical protein
MSLLWGVGSIAFGALVILRRKSAIREAHGERNWLPIETQERMYVVAGGIFIAVGVGTLIAFVISLARH